MKRNRMTQNSAFLSQFFKSSIVISLGLALAVFATSALSAPVQVGDQLEPVQLTMQSPDGEEFEQDITEAAEAGRYVALDFFSVYCGPCKRNLPMVHKLQQRLEGIVDVRLVFINRQVDAVKTYLEDQAELISFDVAFDTGRRALRQFGVRATPTLIIVDDQRRVVYTHVGGLTEADLDEIEQLTESN